MLRLSSESCKKSIMLREKSSFVDLDKVFTEYERLLEWAMRRKGISEVLVRSMFV